MDIGPLEFWLVPGTRVVIADDGARLEVWNQKELKRDARILRIQPQPVAFASRERCHTE